MSTMSGIWSQASRDKAVTVIQQATDRSRYSLSEHSLKNHPHQTNAIAMANVSLGMNSNRIGESSI